MSTTTLARMLWTVLALSTTAVAAKLTDTDLREGLAQLDRTRNDVIAATKGLSEEQWKFKPAPDRWSVAEILEHIVLTEDALRGNISEKIMAAPAGSPDRDYKATDKFVLGAIVDRSRRAQAPEAVRPIGRWSPEDTLDQFTRTREKTVALLRSTPELRDHVLDSPLGQPLDGYQWILFISAHSERHTKQMLEVKADPSFPKNATGGKGGTR